MNNEDSAQLEKNQQAVYKRLSSSFKNNRIGHAYLFDGSRGTGKMAAALFFAKLLLCEKPNNNVPCETCPSCRRVRSGNHPNVTIIEPDGQDIKRGQMSDLIFKMTKKGYESGRKIYIVSSAERMNVSAANTLLKFLEEPEGEVTAILLTDAYQAILPTIQSRCQRISFLPPSREMLIDALVKKELTDAMAATVSMVTADLDEAYRLASDEQFVHMRKTVLKLVEALDRHVHEALLFIHSDWIPLFKEKEDFERGLDLLLYAYRDIVSVKAALQSMPTYPDQQQFFNNLSIKMPYNQLSLMMEAILQAKKYLHSNMNRTLLMEQLVLNMQEGLRVV
ncbi:DNA polymerase III subunit delta' [Sporosarcina sp. HYO08]|uniref:DNA polymerase III subunit delta' n=1 Tax=Sporosarcina sp. HYO08 TaxID=1759557 RepID=UPI00079AB877|nr:DNA polymerase III subunit delta' [Sporosarcina sp. HYO08]KXH86846.1 DNA polymerase III subunit delta' [Sporosarcina sp. HYO08]